MRALRTLIIVVVLFIVCTSAKNSFRNDQKSLSKSVTLNAYIDAVKRGKPGELNKIIAPKATFSMLYGAKLSTCSKQEMMAFVKKNKNIEGDFKADSKIVNNSINDSVFKIAIRSNNLTSDNYVTIANTGYSWKVTNVYSVLK